jgi:hypothetical protein
MNQENRAPYNDQGISVSRTEINGEEVFLVARIVSMHKTAEAAYAAANELLRKTVEQAANKGE